ncbi:hypothetical protein EI94DRAFT_1707251 [Lactarius quietus]|nr:hypothetical protein EI94DRAFT_1707251 [Lactarius quietus]
MGHFEGVQVGSGAERVQKQYKYSIHPKCSRPAFGLENGQTRGPEQQMKENVYLKGSAVSTLRNDPCYTKKKIRKLLRVLRGARAKKAPNRPKHPCEVSRVSLSRLGSPEQGLANERKGRKHTYERVRPAVAGAAVAAAGRTMLSGFVARQGAAAAEATGGVAATTTPLMSGGVERLRERRRRGGQPCSLKRRNGRVSYKESERDRERERTDWAHANHRSTRNVHTATAVHDVLDASGHVTKNVFDARVRYTLALKHSWNLKPYYRDTSIESLSELKIPETLANPNTGNIKHSETLRTHQLDEYLNTAYFNLPCHNKMEKY